MAIHKLKTWPMYFGGLKYGSKNFDVRKNDRNFILGDELLFEEFVQENYDEDNEKGHYTGEILHRKIVYILKGENFGIMNGFVVLGLEKI